MLPPAPLQLLQFWNSEDVELKEHFETVERAFVGEGTQGGYLSTGEDLGLEVRAYVGPPVFRSGVASLLDAASHTLVVAFAGHGFLASSAQMHALATIKAAIAAQPGRHELLVVHALSGASRRKLERFFGRAAVSLTDMGEPAARSTLCALHALHRARLLLWAGIRRRGGDTKRALTLFISHAKLDGLPLAQSLDYMISTIPWLRTFYDATDLASVADWKSAMKKAAQSSVLIILRTEIYELRYWCRQETLWAEEAVVPTVLVEARTGLSYPAGELPLERMPSVRIPDGNLFRVIHVALREGLRHLMFQRRVLEMKRLARLKKGFKLVALSYPPGMTALLKVSADAGATRLLVLYPDPPLRRGLFHAAEALLSSVAPGSILATPDTLLAL